LFYLLQVHLNQEKEGVMMPVVRITDQTWARLQKHAKPLVDTPDSVINAALDAFDLQKGEPIGALNQHVAEQRQKNPDLTPQKEFRAPLLISLLELGGNALVSKIREETERKVASKLKAGDRELVSSGDIRWWNAICWERADLVREGLFRSDSPRGSWALTEKGTAEAKALKASQPGHRPKTLRLRRKINFI
jgi:hypothetical protein